MSCSNTRLHKKGELINKILKIRDGIEIEVLLQFKDPENKNQDLLLERDKDELHTAFNDFLSEFIDSFDASVQRNAKTRAHPTTGKRLYGQSVHSE
ncbi:hypothetical protein AC578_9188 [Pseudocercospora eumusae]|uniref:Uncharacterized protein n=1 Tax=Pseudocercospora eumusae TaxID=321146 RepID=A0A139HV16_9PEZI|nr:hypothetical protein AC578_9188 [Pseudocercospora eumusae]